MVNAGKNYINPQPHLDVMVYFFIFRSIPSFLTSPLSSPDTDFENKSILLQAEITTVSEESFYLYDQRICGDFLSFKLKEFLL